MKDQETEKVQVTLRDVYNKMENLEDAFQEHTVTVAVAFGKRPTRLEVLSVFGGGVASVGLLLTIVSFL